MSASVTWDVQELGNETVVFHRQTGEVHVLNATAAAIWKAYVDQKKDFGAILEDLKRQYPQVSVAQLQDDLQVAVQQLRAKGLIAS